MLELQKYIRQNNRILRKKYRKTLVTPLLYKIHYLQNLQKMILNYLKNHFLNKKAFFLYSLVLFYFFIFRDFAWAETTTPNQAVNWAIDLLNPVIFIISLIVQPLSMFAGWLLSPDWVFGDIINLRPVLHNIWIMVSNFVYIIFAFFLVAIAFMNIFWKSESYAIKKKLPRLVVWILIVPFTWFIVSAVLSISTILTASVISFSYDSIAKFSSDGAITGIKFIPKNIKIDLTEDSDYEWTTKEEQAKNHASAKNVDCSKEPKDTTKCLSLEDLLWSWKWAYNLLPIYAYGIFKIDKLKDISDKMTSGSIRKVWDIVKKLTFWAIFALIFAILLIAIIFALFTRMIMLWLFAAFSPLFALDFFLEWKWLWKMWESLKKYVSITKFISLAMVPVYLSAALSFWLVFLSFAMTSKFEWNPDIKINSVDTNWDQVMEFWKLKMTIVGTYEPDSKWLFDWALSMWSWMISNIIISVLALVILWMAVMAALSSDEITKRAIDPIAQFWGSIWKLALEAPKYIPLKIPGGGGKSITMAGMWTLWSNIEWAVRQAAIKESWEIWTAFGSKIAESLWYTLDENTRKMKEIVGLWPKAQTHEWANKYLEDLRQSSWKFSDFVKDSAKRWLYAEGIAKINDDILWKENKENFIKALKNWNEQDIKNAIAKIESEKKVFWEVWEMDIWSSSAVPEYWDNWKVNWKQITIKDPKFDWINKDDKTWNVNVKITDNKDKNISQNLNLNLSDYKDKTLSDIQAKVATSLKDLWIENTKFADEIAKKIKEVK